jgi:hypothetical protein
VRAWAKRGKLVSRVDLQPRSDLDNAAVVALRMLGELIKRDMSDGYRRADQCSAASTAISIPFSILRELDLNFRSNPITVP